MAEVKDEYVEIYIELFDGKKIKLGKAEDEWNEIWLTYDAQAEIVTASLNEEI